VDRVLEAPSSQPQTPMAASRKSIHRPIPLGEFLSCYHQTKLKPREGQSRAQSPPPPPPPPPPRPSPLSTSHVVPGNPRRQSGVLGGRWPWGGRRGSPQESPRPLSAKRGSLTSQASLLRGPQHKAQPSSPSKIHSTAPAQPRDLLPSALHLGPQLCGYRDTGPPSAEPLSSTPPDLQASASTIPSP
jgi:hypothetical protein